MSKKFFFNFTAILSLVCFLQVSSAAAQTYEVIIYEPTAGFSDTDGAGIRGNQRVGSGRISGSTSPEHTHALLWTGNSIVPTDLHPANFTYSAAFDTDGTRQVGYVELNLFPQVMRRAALWSSSASSLIVLSNNFSEAVAIAGDQQVGYVDTTFTCSECGPTGGRFAALWRGTSQSLVNLHPPLFGCRISQASDTDGMQQVGSCFFQIPQMISNYRALLWSGTAQSVVVLHPANYFNSFAVSVKNGVQVGFGNTGTYPNLNPSDALLWRGTAQSVVVLGRGTALGTNGATHVGEVDGGNNRSNAFRWDGDSGAGFNLHTLLPAGVYENSTANDIDAAGNIFGTAQLSDGRVRAVEWTPTPDGNVCTPFTTVTEGNLFPGGIVSFGVSSGSGSVTIDHVNAGSGLQSLTVVGAPTNAVVNIPAFAPGIYAPVVATFTPVNPALAVDFTLRTASTFHAANIRVRCGTPTPPL
jgi:hypothetical protein